MSVRHRDSEPGSGRTVPFVCSSPVCSDQDNNTYEVYTLEDVYDPDETYETASSALTLGIVSLAISWIPIACIVSIILGCIARRKALAYRRTVGRLSGKARTANILGTAGLICGIVFTAIYVVIAVALLGMVGIAHWILG